MHRIPVPTGERERTCVDVRVEMACVKREVPPREIVVLHVDIAIVNEALAYEEIMRLIAGVRLRVVPPDGEQTHQDHHDRRPGKLTTAIARGADPAAATQ